MDTYLVNYTISTSYTVFVQAESPEDAQNVVEEIYQNNFDALPEDGDLDHDIDLGIAVPADHAWTDILTIGDAS